VEGKGLFELQSVEFYGGNHGGQPSASVFVATPWNDEKPVHASSSGVGVIDAVFKALEKATHIHELPGKYRLERWAASPHNGRGQSDALCVATVNLRVGSAFGIGRGTDPDTVIASAKAFVSAREDLQRKLDEQTQRRLLHSVSVSQAATA
jgi:2-isopropylmalate synthase